MLENLDSVDWSNIDGAYGSATNVPALFRAVDGAQSIAEFEKAYGELFNVVNHQGTIYEATAPASRFIIQMLETTNDTNRRNYHLSILTEMLRNSQYHPPVWGDYLREPQPITHYRFELSVYYAIAEKAEIFVHLLSNEHMDNRAGSAYVLSFLVDRHEQSLPALVECIEDTTDPWLEAICVWSYAKLAYYGVRYPTDPYVKQLREWVEQTENTFHMRYAAALGHLRLSSAYPASMVEAERTTPEVILDIVAQGLQTDIWEETPADTAKNPLHYIYAEATPFDSAMDIITRHNRVASKPYTWVALLRRMDVSPIQAHLYCREILNIAFLRIMAGNFESYWDNLHRIHTRKQYTDLIYQHEKQVRHYQSEKPLTDVQKLALDAIVSCNPFWEIPTNLFSFYYGLPDDREALRQLITS